MTNRKMRLPNGKLFLLFWNCLLGLKKNFLVFFLFRIFKNVLIAIKFAAELFALLFHQIIITMHIQLRGFYYSKTVILRISLRLEIPLFSSKARLKLPMMQAQTELSTAMDLDTLTATSIKRQSAFLQTTVSHASVASKFLRVIKQMESTKIDLLELSDWLQRVLKSNSKHS